jgi:hypothetical protein
VLLTSVAVAAVKLSHSEQKRQASNESANAIMQKVGFTERLAEAVEARSGAREGSVELRRKQVSKTSNTISSRKATNNDRRQQLTMSTKKKPRLVFHAASPVLRRRPPRISKSRSAKARDQGA